MSGHKTAGAGSPVWFRCTACRSTTRREATIHWVVRTGRVKPRKAKPGSAFGIRQLRECHEYRCTCGHVGWSSHSGVLQRPLKTVTEVADSPVRRR